MCIIAYSKNKKISEDILRNCFENNPDGAGIMYKDKLTDRVILVKGMMKIEDLLKEYEKVPEDVENAIHCRIATSGKVQKETCHPFPLRSSVKKMRNLNDSTSIGIMHNGIISFCAPKDGIRSKFSDTMQFSAEYLYNLKGSIDNKAVQKLISEATNSRFLIMRQGLPTILIGDWNEDKDIQFSNTSYIKRTIYPTKNYDYFGSYGRFSNRYYDSYYGYMDDDYFDTPTIQATKTEDTKDLETYVISIISDIDMVKDYVWEMYGEETLNLNAMSKEQIEIAIKDELTTELDSDISQIEEYFRKRGIEIKELDDENYPNYIYLKVKASEKMLGEMMNECVFTGQVGISKF